MPRPVTTVMAANGVMLSEACVSCQTAKLSRRSGLLFIPSAANVMD